MRAFWLGSSNSVLTPSASLTSAVRPPSAGRVSDQTTSSPSTRTSESPTAFAMTTSEVIGVGQEP